MDVASTGLCSVVPFSVCFRIGCLLKEDCKIHIESSALLRV